MRQPAEARWSNLDSGWVGAGADDDLDRRLAAEEESFDLRRPHVMTALGPIVPGALGVTLVHEHVATQPVAGSVDPDVLLDDVHASLAELEDLHAGGGGAIVDATTADLGRDIEAVRWLAARAPVHVVVVTGSSRDGPGATDQAAGTVDEVAAGFLRELTEGIEGTPTRAGAILIGTSAGDITAGEAVGLRAAGRAHRVTPAPIMVDAGDGTTARQALAILGEEGVEAARVIVSRLDARIDGDDPRSMLETGACVAFDRVSQGGPAADEARATTIKGLVDAGYGDRLLLSGTLGRSALRAYGGTLGWVSLLERFPLLLMEAGLDAPAVRRLLVENPARALTIGEAEA